MSKTLLIVPTFRDSRQAIATLNYLSNFTDDSLHLLISDCSQNATKHESLLKISNNNKYVSVLFRSERTLLYKDVSDIILKTSSYDFIGIFPDDDLVSLDYILNSIKILEQNSDVICSYGNYLIQLSNDNIFRDSREVLQENCTDRVRSGFNPNYFNTMFFAVFRKTGLIPWAKFCINHPFVSSFFDFIHCASLMSQGKIKCHNHGSLLWEAVNWDRSDVNAETRKRYYSQVDMHNFDVFHDVHFAVESVNFFLGEYLEIEKADRIQCASFMWETCINRFKNTNPNFIFTDYFNSLTAESKDAILFLINSESLNHQDIIINFSKFMENFSIEKSKNYKSYFLNY